MLCVFISQRVEESLSLTPTAQTLASRGSLSHVDPGPCRRLGLTTFAQAVVSEPHTSPPVTPGTCVIVLTCRPGAVCPPALTQSARPTNNDKWTRGRGSRQVPGAQHTSIQTQFCCIFLGSTKMLRGALNRRSSIAPSVSPHNAQRGRISHPFISAHNHCCSGCPAGSAICLQRRRPGLHPWVRKFPWRRAWQPTPGFLPWRIPWTEEPGGASVQGSQRVRHD